MSIALSGASGFIGRHVLAELAQRGRAVKLLARPSTVMPAAGEHLLHRAPMGSALARGLSRGDTLVHLAWGGLPQYRSLHHFERELPAQFAFLSAAVAAGVRHIVVAGTCFEYGMQSGALHEQLDARPGNPYAFAKDALRRQLEFLQREQPFELTWARLFYMHGEGQAPGSLWPLLRGAVERGDPTFPMSGGEQLRDYLPVNDVATLLVALADLPHGAGIVNVCSGRPVSVRSLVEGWIAAHGWNIRADLGRYAYSDFEPMAFWGDNHKLLQYVPPA